MKEEIMKSRLREVLENRKKGIYLDPSYGFPDIHTEIAWELRDDLLRKVIEENKRKEESEKI